MSNIEVSILLPCLNEEYTLDKRIKTIKKVLDKKYKYEIIVCDNNSIDNSISIAKKNKVNYIIEEKKGYGSTLLNGINNANGKYIVMLDADLSYDENDIITVIKELKNGYDLVIGNRFKGNVEKKAMPTIHKYGSKLLNIFANILFKNNIKDYHCGLRGFKKEIIYKTNINSTGMEFASEMLIEAKVNKLKIKQFNTNYYKDGRNKKSNLRTIRDGIRHLLLILKKKYDHSIFFRYTSTFIITISILMLFLILNTFIPQKNVKNNTIESFDYYYKNQKVGYLNNTSLRKDSYKIDYMSDTKSLNMSYFLDKNNIYDSLIEMNYYKNIDFKYENYTYLIENKNNENYELENYSRYWQGQTIYIRTLLNFFSVQTIYRINIMILIILLLILSVKLFKTDKILLLVFLAATVVVNSFIVPFCLEYFFVYIIMLISSIIILNMNKRKSNNIDLLFLITGMCTNFFDFLTCETLTLTVPLFFLIYITNNQEKKLSFKNILKYIILWGLGYTCTFILKWILACLHFKNHFGLDILNKMSVRVYYGEYNYFALTLSAIIKNLKCLFPFNELAYPMTLMLVILMVAIYKFLYKIKNKKDFVYLILISFIPLVRFAGLSSHSHWHYYFTYRALLPLVMLVLLVLVKKSVK